MRYRKLTTDSVAPDGTFVPGGDYTFGHGQADFWHDVPEAPAQHALTRLRLQLGEWFLDRREGTPWKTRVLGKHTEGTRDPVIRFRVLSTSGVTGIAEYFSNLDRETRGFSVNLTVDTVYGRVAIKGPI
jgi:hypothetical protein